MGKPVLYTQPFTIFDRRVLTYLREKGIEDEIEIVHLDHTMSAPGRRAGQTPVLAVAKGETQDLTESVAIIEYLEDKFPQEPKLRGADAYASAKTRSLIYAMETAIPNYFVYLITASQICTLVGQNTNPEAARICLAYGHKYLGVLESELPSNGPLLTESQKVTTADIVLAVTFHYSWHWFGSPMWETHPRLEQFWNAVKDWPSLDHQNWANNYCNQELRDLSQQLVVRWSDLSEAEKRISKKT